MRTMTMWVLILLAGLATGFSPAVAAQGVPAALSIVTGDNQTATVNKNVSGLVCVQVKDSDGAVVVGTSVTFTVATGGGSVTGGTQTSDNSGIVTLGSWKLGTLVGTNSLSVTCGAAPAIAFHATSKPDVPATISKQAGDSQAAAANSTVAVAPSVLVQDAFGNNVADGTTVTFMVASGGGSITSGSPTTMSGTATVGSWKLGPTPGTNTLTASCASAPVATFSATSAAGAPATISIVSGNNQSATVNTFVSTVVCVQVKDPTGNNVASGTPVTFAIASGGGTITGGSSSVGSGGIATLGSWQLGTASGANSLNVSSGSAPSITFVATALPDAPATMTLASGNNQTAPVGANVAVAVSVKVTDQFSNNVALNTPVTFSIASGGGSISGANAATDANGVATLGSWTLGPAVGTNSLTATCGATPSVTFNANGVLAAPPMITSGPTATPNPGIVAQPVTFSVAVSGTNVSYTWDFGDGSNLLVGSDASVSHRYAAPGPYTATVTISDGFNPSISASLSLTIIPAVSVVGAGPDSDGDGFSDTFETVAGTLPNNATSSPIGQTIANATIQNLALKSALIKLSFNAKKPSDSITFAGTLPVPQGFTASGATLLFDVGGVAKRLVLTPKATAVSGGDSTKLTLKSVKGVVIKQTANFTATFNKGSFETTLSSSGLTNADNPPNTKVTLTFTVIFNNTIYQVARPMNYSSKAGKTGMAK